VLFDSFYITLQGSIVNLDVWCFGCRRFWLCRFSNGFSSLQFFIVFIDVTLGVMMIAFGMTVTVIVRVQMVGLATPHNQHGCDD